MADDMDQVLDLDEPAEVLNMLLSLLHTPPGLPERKPDVENHSKTALIAFEPGSVVPLPLLPRMLHLADKYALSETLQRSLLAHMSAHTSIYPLQIYAFATGVACNLSLLTLANTFCIRDFLLIRQKTSRSSPAQRHGKGSCFCMTLEFGGCERYY
jgi:hypothetical protein